MGRCGENGVQVGVSFGDEKMKLKTFFIAYILFLAVLLGALGTVSIYLTNHQMETLREQSKLEYERIAGSMVREINIVYQRGGEQAVIDALLESYVSMHRNRGIELSILPYREQAGGVLSVFESRASAYVILVRGNLTTIPRNFHLQVIFHVTERITELREIQRILLYLFIVFSLLAAMVLYITLTKIFKPLEVVARSAQKIAAGKYNERIQILGKNELAVMATQFNQMAIEIEKQINLLKEEAERKQQFVDNLAHEIRTPLTSIYGYAEYMQKGFVDEEDRVEATTYLLEEATHLRNITNSMLELAALRNYTLKKEEIPLLRLFQQVAASLELPFRKYGVNLEVQPLDDVLVGQEDLLKSLLMNLCINGAKACDKGGRVILSGIRTNEQLILLVEDNGCGMTQGEIERIIEPFYQVDEVRNRDNDGVGLGLTLCRKIVELHGATMQINSETDVGTKVTISFTNVVTV